MRGLVLFAAGIVCGVLMMQPVAGQASRGKGLRLNHVGISVRNYQESLDFYTKTMGFREAFTVRDADGKPFLTYIQISRETFLELQPAAADRPAGVSHIGVWADDVNSTVTDLRKNGVKIDDVRTGRTNAPLTNMTDPNGVRIELVELSPGSLQRKAVDGWK
jgi:catechol 2,3-dioxygenase-like lactoylglutathione lyase family enzyme